MHRLAVASPLLLAVSLPAQIGDDQVVVASRFEGSPATRLLRVDLNSGAQTVLGRFPSDHLPPLAVKIDYVNDDIVVALALGDGGSRIVRVGLAGTQVRYERVLADVPHPVEELSVGTTAPHDGIYYAVSGLRGGLHRVPRWGGETTEIAHVPWASAIAYIASATPIAISGNPATQADPSFGYVFLSSGQVSARPPFAGFGAKTVTGFSDGPSGQYYAHGDGTVSHTPSRSPGPLVQPVAPQRPPGGTRALRLSGNPAFFGLVLGGAADPTLKAYDPRSLTPQTWQFIGPRLPGDPIDFDIGWRPTATMFFYGAACGTTTSRNQLFMSGNGQFPRIGNANFGIRVQQALPLQTVTAIVGDNDQAFGDVVLPFTLPSGCGLAVAPIWAASVPVDATGRADQLLSIPNAPALLGTRLHAQWLQQTQAGIASSGLISVRIGS